MKSYDASQRDSSIGRGWAWLVLLASYGTILVITLTMYMSGVLYVAFLDNYNEGPAKTSIIGSLNTGLYAAVGPFASVLINVFSCRTSIVLGGLLCSISFFVAFFLNSIDMFTRKPLMQSIKDSTPLFRAATIIALGIFDGIGICMACVPATVVLAYNFVERRRLVISLASVVPGFGMFVSSPLCLFLLETYGLKGTLLIISGIQMQVVVFGMICRPSSLELEVKRNTKETSVQLNRKHKHQRLTSPRERFQKLKSTLNIDLLFKSSFFLFLISTLTWGFVYSLCLVHLPNYVVTTTSVNADITGVMSTFSTCTIIGRILAVLTIEDGQIDTLILHTGMCGVLGCFNILLPFYGVLPGSVYVYAGFSGAYLGGLNAVLCPITLVIVGIENFSTGHGMAYLFCGIGQIIGPYLGGILFGLTGTYDSTFIIGGVVVLFGSFFGLLSSAKLHQPVEKNPCDSYNKEINIEDRPPDSDAYDIDPIDCLLNSDNIESDQHDNLANYYTQDRHDTSIRNNVIAVRLDDNKHDMNSEDIETHTNLIDNSTQNAHESSIVNSNTRLSN